jgi:hypothetical protein
VVNYKKWKEGWQWGFGLLESLSKVILTVNPESFQCGNHFDSFVRLHISSLCNALQLQLRLVGSEFAVWRGSVAPLLPPPHPCLQQWMSDLDWFSILKVWHFVWVWFPLEVSCCTLSRGEASKRCLERVFPNLIDRSAHRRYVFFHMLEKSSKFTWKVCYRRPHMVYVCFLTWICLFPYVRKVSCHGRYVFKPCLCNTQMRVNGLAH